MAKRKLTDADEGEYPRDDDRRRPAIRGLTCPPEIGPVVT
jgi:hypothetical protein